MTFRNDTPFRVVVGPVTITERRDVFAGHKCAYDYCDDCAERRDDGWAYADMLERARWRSRIRGFIRALKSGAVEGTP